MANRILAAGLALALTTSVAFAATTSSDLVASLTAKIESFKTAAVDQMITEDLVRRMVRRWQSYGNESHLTYAAREEVLSTFVCPVFGDDYDNPESDCGNVMAVVDSVDNLAFYADSFGIPIEAMNLSAAIKKQVYHLAIDYLDDAARAGALYQKYRGVILEEVNAFDQDRHKQFVADATAACNAVGLWNNPAAMAAYSAFMPNDAGLQAGTVDYDQYTASRGEFEAAVGDINAFKFLGRRHDKGGDALVAVYAAACADILPKVIGTKI